MKTRPVSALVAAVALTFAVGFAAPAARAQDDATALLDGAQKGIEKIKKEMKAQSESRKQMKDLDNELKRISAVQTELAKNLDGLQQARRESEASTARLMDKIQHLARQVEHLETEAQDTKRSVEAMSKAPASASPAPAPATPPVQPNPGSTPAPAPSAAPTPGS